MVLPPEVRVGRPTLPSNETDPADRAARLGAARDTWRYAYDWPVGVATAAEVPEGEGYGVGFTLRALPVYVEIGVDLAAMAIDGFESGHLADVVKKRFTSIDEGSFRQAVLSTPKDLAAGAPLARPATWQGYRAQFATWAAPAVVAALDDPTTADASFAWQRVAGVNPMVIRRILAAPAELSPARFAAATGGDSPAAAAAEGRLYEADYSALADVRAGVTDGVQKYVPAPTAWFALDRTTRALLPVGIRVRPGGAVFHPNDGWRWVIAKAHVQSADANVHETTVHLGRTHLVMEAAGLSLHRQLSDAHPLHVLLKAHVETTFAINQSAKTSLIAPNGTVDRCFAPAIDEVGALVQQAVSTYALDTTDPRRDLGDRGLDDPTTFPNHPYRDAAVPLWDAILDFATAYVGLYYDDDAAVAGDPELRAFVAELSSPDGGRLTGVPAADTRTSLSWLVARLIFVAGPQHSAVNFPQFPTMAYPPNMPGATYAPAPTADTPDDPAELLKTLPPWRQTIEGSTMVYLLSNVRSSRLGEYGLLHFQDLRVHSVLVAYQRRLAELEAADAAADASRPWSYPWLRPSQVLQSVSI